MISNIGILTSSSFIISVAHTEMSMIMYLVSLSMGIIFMTNQIDELFSAVSINSSDELSLVYSA